MSSSDRAQQRILEDIDALGLQRHLTELTARGYTTIRGVLSEATVENAKSAILNRVARNTGKDINPATAEEDDYRGMTYLPYLLYLPTSSL